MNIPFLTLAIARKLEREPTSIYPFPCFFIKKIKRGYFITYSLESYYGDGAYRRPPKNQAALHHFQIVNNLVLVFAKRPLS